MAVDDPSVKALAAARFSESSIIADGKLLGARAAKKIWRRSLCRLLRFQVGLPFAFARERIHPRAVGEGPLAGGDVFSLARPGLLRRRLQRATIGEGKTPRQTADPVHGVEMR